MATDANARARPGVAAAIVASCLLACGHEPPAAAPPYNVLFVSLDTARQDVLGCYGRRPRHAPDTPITPSLDRLSTEGVRMLDAYASAPWTLPSHLSMLTGQPTLVHGVETFFDTLDGSHPLLQEILKDRGYHTSGVFSGPYLEPHWGFGRGFDRYRALYGPMVTAASEEAADLRARIDEAKARHDDAELDRLMQRQQDVFQRLETLSERDVNSEQVTAGALEELERLARGGEPWFLFAHYFDPHYDYVPPPPYATRYDPDYGGTITGVDFIHDPDIAVADPGRPGAWLRRVAERDLEHLIALYEGEMAWVDAHVGTLLARLDALGLGPRTLVIVVGDHGDEFFEHGGIGHHRTLYEEAVKVPMLLRLPGVLPTGAAVPGVVSVADLMPTVLYVLGLPIPAGLGSSSFLPLARGRAGAEPRAALLRLVDLQPGSVTLDGRTTIAIRQVRVQETFRQGRVKITRRRSWPQFPPDVAGEVRAVLQDEADRQFRREELEWTDVERFPAEREADHSTEFADPAARAALDAFRKTYGGLVALRRRGQPTPPPADLVHRLQGLGYVDARVAEFWAASPDTALPPPGTGGPP